MSKPVYSASSGEYRTKINVKKNQISKTKHSCQKWDLNPRPENRTAT